MLQLLLRSLCLSLLLVGVVAAQPDAAKETETFSDGPAGDAIIGFVRAAEATGFSGAVLAARGGKVVAAVGVGMADAKDKQPNTPATLFEIASLTKQFTAAAMLRLAQDGKVKLDEPIGTYLPGVPEDCAAITVRHLLSHTSGIPGSNSEGRGHDLAAVLPLFLKGGPRHPPGTHWEYWNQGYSLAAEIITRASGMPYTDYCKEKLFVPAGMTMSCFTGDEAKEGWRVAMGTSARGPPRSALEHPYGEYGFQYQGMGGAVCTVWDLWRWDRALRGDTVLDGASRAALFKPGLGEYGLGWFVRASASGRVVQSHSGGVRGFVCEMRRYPGSDACVIVLANSDGVGLRRVVDGVEERLLGDAVTWRPPGAIDEKLLAALVGSYTSEKGAKLVIESQQGLGRTTIHWPQGRYPATRAVLGLNAKGELTYFEEPDVHTFTIERDAAGAVVGVSIGDLVRFARER